MEIRVHLLVELVEKRLQRPVLVVEQVGHVCEDSISRVLQSAFQLDRFRGWCGEKTPLQNVQLLFYPEGRLGIGIEPRFCRLHIAFDYFFELDLPVGIEVVLDADFVFEDSASPRRSLVH